MRGGYIQFCKTKGIPESRLSTAVERAKELHREKCERQRAIAMNKGVGHAKDQEKGR
jgi:hypothetical protein